MSHDHPTKECGHLAAQRDECHTSTVMPCAIHFARLCAEAMQAALPGAERGAFRHTIIHLNNDRMAAAAWWTWMAMISRYMLEPGTDPLEALRLGTPPVPPDAPAAYRDAVPLVSFAVRSAVLNDFTALDTALGTVNSVLSPEAALTFLRSCAGTAAVCVERNDAIRSQDLHAWAVLGSQVSSAAGSQVLPLLVDMVLAHPADNATAVVGELFERLVRLPGREPLAAAVDILGRAIAQTVTPDATVVLSQGVPGRPGSDTEGLVDVATATEENTERAIMAGVWALRTAEAYAQAADEDDATRRLRAVIRRHGRPGTFAMDVVLAGTQVLGYSHAMDLDARGGDTPVAGSADHPSG